MTPVVIQPAEMQELGRALFHLWGVTVIGMLLMSTDFGSWYDRLRVRARRRRIRAIRARKAVRHG